MTQRGKVFAVYAAPEAIERLRDAAVWLNARDPSVSISSILTEAIDREVHRLAKQHNRGKPFPARGADPKPGRRRRG